MYELHTSKGPIQEKLKVPHEETFGLGNKKHVQVL